MACFHDALSLSHCQSVTERESVCPTAKVHEFLLLHACMHAFHAWNMRSYICNLLLRCLFVSHSLFLSLSLMHLVHLSYGASRCTSSCCTFMCKFLVFISKNALAFSRLSSSLKIQSDCLSINAPALPLLQSAVLPFCSYA